MFVLIFTWIAQTESSNKFRPEPAYPNFVIQLNPHGIIKNLHQCNYRNDTKWKIIIFVVELRSHLNIQFGSRSTRLPHLNYEVYN